MKKTAETIALLMSICFGAFASFAEITTGWLSPLDGGTYTWSDTANWVNGEINGIFSEELVGSGKTYPTIVFSADATLSGGLTLAYTNDEQNLTFRGDGTDRTLTLGGPLVMNLGNATKGAVKFGSATAGQGLSLHFTCVPEFQIDNGPWPEVFQAISGEGEALVTGSRDTACILKLRGDAATFPGAVSVSPNKGLYFFSDWGSKGATRASSVRLDRADIVVQGNTGKAVEESISGALTIAGGGMAQFAHYYNGNYKNHTLRVGSLVMEPGAMLDIHSPSLVLGTTDFESGNNNFVATGGVTAYGNGAAGTVFAPVVPWARASNNNSTGDNLFGYLVSYHATRGFRILDRDTEQEHYEAGYVGLVTNQNANVYVGLANEIVEFTGTNVINSLQFTSSGKAATVRAYDGTLTVSSGAIDMTGSDNITLNANLVFGNVPAYITYRGDKTGYLKGSVSGSAGITFQSMAQVAERNSGVYVEATGSYTGPTYVNSRLFVSTDAFLPHGERLGDMFVNGILQSFTGAITMNGLNGKGALRFGQTYATTFTIGDNNANGDFTGSIERASGSGTVNVTKIGTGVQRLAGHCTHNGTTTVSGGTLIVDGDFTASSVTVAAGAALGGSGGITNNVTFTDGAKLAVAVADDVASCLTVAGTVSGGPVTVNVDTTGRKWRTAQCVLRSGASMAGVSFVKGEGEGVGLVELRNSDTELWVTPKKVGFFVIVR